MAGGPREQVLAHGASSLSDRELLQVVLNSGNKVALRQTLDILFGLYPHLQGLLTALPEALMAVPGIGQHKAALVLAAVELGQRALRASTMRAGQVTTSAAVAKHMQQRLMGLAHEVIIAVFLDTKNQIIQEQTVAQGGFDQAVADPRVVFGAALRANASKVLLVHNHPSGDATPSQADISVTRRFYDAGGLLGVALLDHVIVGTHDYYSFRQHDASLRIFKAS